MFQWFRSHRMYDCMYEWRLNRTHCFDVLLEFRVVLWIPPSAHARVRG